MMWLFVQNCFLLRDWIANDDKVPKEEKEVVLDKSFASTPIQYARALCEGTKHLAPGKKVRPFHVNITIEPRGGTPAYVDYIVDVPGGAAAADILLARIARKRSVSRLKAR